MENFPLYRWWKAQEIEKKLPERLLKSRERYCVAACSRFRTMNYLKDHAWVLSDQGKCVAAMLLHSSRTLFPVFNGNKDVYIPAFLLRALKNIDIYAIQGLKHETEMLERILSPLGFKAVKSKEYNLMMFDKHAAVNINKAPADLFLRICQKEDLERLLPLQEIYEKEEVLPSPDKFDRRVCRYNLSKIISKGQCLIAEIDGQIVGKLNTNAESFSCNQIGGVFVLPSHRGKGIATCMTAAFTRRISSAGKEVTLYVKKQNAPAAAVYKKCGFQKIADYRIVYM
ncbi:MAG: hypothetical protein Ta2F_10980 [Termitinemataceae bacterium]|nr:MAG: hypothetical protein Ta2F_10980 [Termitinemataceae bacterium]